MSMSTDITLGTASYSTTVSRPTSTVRNDGTQPIDEPISLTVSHETAKNGKVNSVVYIDIIEKVPCDSACQLTPGVSGVRGQFKLSYNPLEGAADLAANTALAIDQIKLFLSDTALVAKLLNKEH